MKLLDLPDLMEIPDELILGMKSAMRLAAEGMISSVQTHLLKLESKDKREALVAMFELKRFFEMISESIDKEMDNGLSD